MEWTNKKKSLKNGFCRGNFTPFKSKSFQMWDQIFPLLFPKDSKSQFFLTSNFTKRGQKDRYTVPQKWTDTHTDRQTHTYGEIDLYKAKAQRADALKRDPGSQDPNILHVCVINMATLTCCQLLNFGQIIFRILFSMEREKNTFRRQK